MNNDTIINKMLSSNIPGLTADTLKAFFNDYNGGRMPDTLKTNYSFLKDEEFIKNKTGLEKNLTRGKNFGNADIKSNLIAIVDMESKKINESSQYSENIDSGRNEILTNNSPNGELVAVINSMIKDLNTNGYVTTQKITDLNRDYINSNLIRPLSTFMQTLDPESNNIVELQINFLNELLSKYSTSTSTPEDTNALNQQIESLKQQLTQSQKDAKDCKTARERLEAEKLQELEQLRNELATSKGLNAESLNLQQQLGEAKQKLLDEQYKVDELENAQRKLEQERDALNKQLANQADLEATLAQLREELLTLQNIQRQLTSEQLAKLNSLNAQISKNEQDKQRSEAEINTQKEAINKHAAALAAQKAAHEEALRKAHEEAEKAAAAAEKKLSEAEARLNAELEQLKAENLQLNHLIQQLNQDAAKPPDTNKLNELIAALQTKNIELAKIKAGLESEKNTLTATNKELNATIGTQDTRMKELERDLVAATAKITELAADVARLTAELDAAKAASGTATEKDKVIANLTTELNALKIQIPGLEKQITELTSQNAQLTKDLAAERSKPSTPPAVVDRSEEIATLTAARDAAIKERDAAIKERDTNQLIIEDLNRKLKSQLSSSSADLQAQLKASEDKVLGLNKKITELDQALSECTNKPSTTTEIKSQSGTNLALNQGMVYIFQETRPLKGGDSATRRIKLQGENLFVEDENHVFQKFDQKFYKDMYVGGEDENVETPHEINDKQIIEAVRNLIPKS